MFKDEALFTATDTLWNRKLAVTFSTPGKVIKGVKSEVA